MAYIEGFVAAVPRGNKDAYQKHAAGAVSFFKEFGATRQFEAWGDDVPDGKVTDVWTGLTMITGLAVGDDGALYALEMATNNIEKPPYTLPGTGRVVRQTGPDSLAEVVVGLDFPIALAKKVQGTRAARLKSG